MKSNLKKLSFLIPIIGASFNISCSDGSPKPRNQTNQQSKSQKSSEAINQTDNVDPLDGEDGGKKEETTSQPQSSNLKPTEWEMKGQVIDGEQLDATAGFDNLAHVIAKQYYQINENGEIVKKENVGESKQTILWAFVYPPAIAACEDKSIYVLIRDETAKSNHNGYFNLNIQKRSSSGDWTQKYQYSDATNVNWNAGIACGKDASAYMFSTYNLGNVWSDIILYNGSANSSNDLGKFSNIYRVDFEARMRSGNGTLFLASSNSFTDSAVYFSSSEMSDSNQVYSQLKNNMKTLKAGTGKNKGFPDLYVDQSGFTHLTYGSGYTDHGKFPNSMAGSIPGEIHYNKFDKNGNAVFSEDQTIFKDMGIWHLSMGLSAVAASANGQYVMAVGLKSPNQKEASNSEMFWVFSSDGGKTFSKPEPVGLKVYPGEGRLRPRIVAIKNSFLLFYKQQSTIGLSMAVMKLK